MSEFKTIEEIIARARDVLEPAVWEYGRAGGGQEVTVRRNRAALHRLAIVPRVLADVSHVDVTTRVLGMDLGLPVMVAPVGTIGSFGAGGAAAAAEGAKAAGSTSFVGTLASPAFDEVQRVSGGGNIFQLYASGDAAWVDEVVARMLAAEMRALCVTVDSPVSGRRDRLLRSGADLRIERHGVPPNLDGIGRDRSWQARFNWKDFARLREQVEVPLVLKGIMHPEDARRAVDVGADAVYVSNHGGRELDHGRSAIEALPEVVDAVSGRAEVMFDSGIRHGTDVLKALALGADAVLIGRLSCWGLAAGGADGVRAVLEILRAELVGAMALSGVTQLSELHPGMVRATIPA